MGQLYLEFVEAIVRQINFSLWLENLTAWGSWKKPVAIFEPGMPQQHLLKSEPLQFTIHL